MYQAIRKPHGKVPWGYDVHPDDPMLLVPDRKAFDYLDEARTWLKVSSLRQVAAWLTKKSGRPISHQALKNIVTREDGHIIRVRDFMDEDDD